MKRHKEMKEIGCLAAIDMSREVSILKKGIEIRVH
jgi:hypothetical protein